MISTVILITSLVVFLVTLLNIAAWPKVGSAGQDWAEQVSVLIPARNEEADLPACLDAVLRQGPAVIEVLVYNDHSTDGTGRIIDEYAMRDPRVRRVASQPLPAGWCGKNFACAQLAAAARGRLILFVDADARLSPQAVVRMVEEMSDRRLKFLSCWPGLELISFWEKALMPTLNFVVFSIFPAPFSLLSGRPSLALAHGACLMFDRDSYGEIGGHSLVRDQIFEDVRLAQLWRARGARALCLDGQDVVRVRMYRTLEEIRRGFQKNFFPAFRHELSFWTFIAFHLLVFLWPFLWIIFAGFRAAIAVIMIILLIRLALAAHFRQPLWSAFLHPLGEMVLISIGLSSWWRCKSGRGVEWRGRQYHSINSGN